MHVEHTELNVIVVAIHLLLHDRAGTLASCLICPSNYVFVRNFVLVFLISYQEPS